MVASRGLAQVFGGSWDLVSKVMKRVAMLIVLYNPS